MLASLVASLNVRAIGRRAEVRIDGLGDSINGIYRRRIDFEVSSLLNEGPQNEINLGLASMHYILMHRGARNGTASLELKTEVHRQSNRFLERQRCQLL